MDDPSNWFALTSAMLVDLVESSGFDVIELRKWPEAAPTRASVRARPVAGPPEFATISYERPLVNVVVDESGFLR